MFLSPPMHRRVIFLLASLMALVVATVIWIGSPDAAQSESFAIQLEVARRPRDVDQATNTPAVASTRPQLEVSPDSPPIAPPHALATSLRSPIVAAPMDRVSPASPPPQTRVPSTRPRVPTASPASERPVRDARVEPPTSSDEEPVDPRVMSRGLRTALPNPSLIFRGLAGSSDVVLEIDRGVQRPVALLENKQSLSPEQANAKDRIAEEFAEKVSEAARNRAGDAPPVDQVWLEEQARANERYRLIFGDDAYNLDTVRAAQEALAGP